MRQRTGGAALVVAACLALTGCSADEAPVRADGPTATSTADPSPSTPSEEPTEPTEEPSGPPSGPTSDEPGTGPTDRVPPRVPAHPPGREPLPQPSDQGSTPRAPSSPAPQPSDPAPTAQPKPPPPPEEVGGPSGALAFGRTYAWDNGLTVSVSRPEPRTAQEDGTEESTETPPSDTEPPPGTGASAGDNASAGTDSAAGTDPAAGAAPAVQAASTAPSAGGEVVAVDLVVTNGTDRPVNTSIFVVMTSGGVDAPAVYDPAAGYTGPPDRIIQPGENVRFTMGFEARDPGDLTLEVRPAYHYVSAIFVHPAAAQG